MATYIRIAVGILDYVDNPKMKNVYIDWFAQAISMLPRSTQSSSD